MAARVPVAITSATVRTVNRGIFLSQRREGAGAARRPSAGAVGAAGGLSRAEIRALLEQYKEMGCRRIVALRGDMPSGMASLRRD